MPSAMGRSWPPSPQAVLADAGIQPGDLIQGVNQRSVASAKEFEEAIRASKEKKVLLLVRHGELSQFVVVPLAE